MTHLLLLLLVSFGTDLAEQKKVLEKQLLTSPEPGKVHIELSKILTTLGDAKASVTHGEKAVELLPKSPLAHHTYAVALRHKMQENPMSWMTGKSTYLKHLEQAIELDKTFAPAYSELAGFHLSAPRFLGSHAGKALELGEELSKYNLDEGLEIILKAYNKKDDNKGKIKALQPLVKRHPKKVNVHLQMAFALQAEGQYKESLGHLDPFTEGELFNKKSLYQAARSRILGNFELEQAIALLDRYVDAFEAGDEPSNADARWRQGLAYKSLNRPDLAKEYFFKALSINTEHEEAKKAIKELD